jgi:transposase-like protein
VPSIRDDCTLDAIRVATPRILMKSSAKYRGELVYLWRAVDQSGVVLDILAQSRRDKRAAKRFFRKLLKGLRHSPGTIVIDKLRSYAAPRTEAMPGVAHPKVNADSPDVLPFERRFLSSFPCFHGSWD